MKQTRNTTNKQSKQGMSNKPRPEIRDDMGTRKSNGGLKKEGKPNKNKG